MWAQRRLVGWSDRTNILEPGLACKTPPNQADPASWTMRQK